MSRARATCRALAGIIVDGSLSQRLPFLEEDLHALDRRIAHKTEEVLKMRNGINPIKSDKDNFGDPSEIDPGMINALEKDIRELFDIRRNTWIVGPTPGDIISIGKKVTIQLAGGGIERYRMGSVRNFREDDDYYTSVTFHSEMAEALRGRRPGDIFSLPKGRGEATVLSVE